MLYHDRVYMLTQRGAEVNMTRDTTGGDGIDRLKSWNFLN